MLDGNTWYHLTGCKLFVLDIKYLIPKNCVQTKDYYREKSVTKMIAIKYK